VKDGVYQNLKYHQWRVDWSRKALQYSDRLLLKLPEPQKDREYRVRVTYSKKIERVEFFSTAKRKFQRFQLVEVASDFDYSLKYENRESIDSLKNRYKDIDDIIIIKNGLVTDTSIANLSFFDGKRWITPKEPLLKGTTRQRLLQNREIFEADIGVEDIQKFEKIALMNAIIGFQEIEIDRSGFEIKL
jgi:4-amino-4-deoxychorismate lyase